MIIIYGATGVRFPCFLNENAGESLKNRVFGIKYIATLNRSTMPVVCGRPD